MVRTSSLQPSSRSRRETLRLTEEGVLPSFRAAAEKLPLSTTCTKTAMSGRRAKFIFVRLMQRFVVVRQDYRCGNNKYTV
ncbi:hypothetical protein BN129_4295 [Cronobacter sakazakii 701]|nr:hypothetical protein BN129_4295 [Cronobacter sakazakii 701]